MYSRYGYGGGIGGFVVLVIIAILRMAAHSGSHTDSYQSSRQEDLVALSEKYKDEAHKLMESAPDYATLGTYLYRQVDQFHDASFEEAKVEERAGTSRYSKIIISVDHDEYFAALFNHMLEQADKDKNAKAAHSMERVAKRIGLAPEEDEPAKK